MSANVDLVRSIYADWERGDFTRADWADPEIEFVEMRESEWHSATGLAGMAAAWREWLEAWDGFRVGVEGYRDLGERVLALNVFSGVGKTSGLEVGQVQTRGASVFDIRDGKVTRLVVYADRVLALADLGLAPDTGRTDT